MSAERHRTEIDGIEIAWSRVAPAAPAETSPVVFLHGLGSSADAFREVAGHPALADRERILVDFPGFGDSARPEAWEYAIEAQADLIAALLRAVAAARVTVVGHSMGGSVAISMATRHPGLVARLVAAEPALDPGTGTLSGHIARQSEASFVARGYGRLLYQTQRQAERGDTVARQFLVTLRQASPAALHRSAVSLRAERSPAFRAQLEALAIPRTVVRGERTTPLSPPLADPAIAEVVIPDAGHTMMVENPAAFAVAVYRSLTDALAPSDGM